jgi:hypothetical protein
LIAARPKTTQAEQGTKKHSSCHSERSEESLSDRVCKQKMRHSSFRSE